MADVPAFVARTARLPFAWGETDCLCWPALLVAEATGRDPAEGLRGTYRTAWGARQALIRAGGLLTLARARMAWRPEGEPGDGVAVARVDGRTFAGVLSGGRLFLKADRGVLMPERFDLLARWSL